MKKSNVYSSVRTTHGVVNNAALVLRKKIYKVLSGLVDLPSCDQVLDVGVTADQDRLESNFFEIMFPEKSRLTCLSDQDASWMEQRWPGLRFVLGDGRCMPFPDDTFDLVFSNAVIEHAGSEISQKELIHECFRVSRRFVFISTPNRWHPLEFHTALPLIHWLPKKWHRKILSAIGFEYLSRPDNLNLLSRKSLGRLINKIGGGGGNIFILFIKFYRLAISHNTLH